MKVLPVAAGASSLTTAGALALRPSAVVVAGVIQLSSLLMLGLIQRSLQRQSQRNAPELMDRANDCGVRVVLHENGGIEITPAGAAAPATSAAGPSPSDRPSTKWMRCTRWVRRHLP